MLQNKNSAVNATLTKLTRSCDASGHLSLQRGTEPIFVGESEWGEAGREAQEAGFRQTGTQNCCAAGGFI